MKIILFPGGFQMVKNYGGYSGVDIWTGEELTKKTKVQIISLVIAAVLILPL